jgi:drug/metabolite transporter superfamily protein YnfA
MDREPFAEALRNGYHSRRFVAGALAVLVVGGTAWLLLGLSRPVGAVAVAAGGLAILRLLVDRWAVDHGHPTLRDWRPRRRVYFVPAGLLVIGVLLAALVPGHTNPLIGVGLWLLSVSVPMAIAIAVRRSLTNVDL